MGHPRLEFLLEAAGVSDKMVKLMHEDPVVYRFMQSFLYGDTDNSTAMFRYKDMLENLVIHLAKDNVRLRGMIETAIEKTAMPQIFVPELPVKEKSEGVFKKLANKIKGEKS